MLREYARVVYAYREAGQAREAADAAEHLLRTFDPGKKNARVDDAAWPAWYERMKPLLRFDDLNKQDRCRADHLTLLDFLYDTREGLAQEQNPERRPAHDRVSVHYEKALLQIQTIRRNYSDSPTVRPVKPEHVHAGVSWLEAIEVEIEFRRVVLATREALSDLALEAARELAPGDEAGARHYRKLADEQIQVLLETAVYSDFLRVKCKLAQIRMQNKDYEGALKILGEVKTGAEEATSEMYIQASRLIAETYFAMGRYEDAADYPRFLFTAGMRNGWKPWPQIESFLKACYAQGARRPALPPAAPSKAP